MYEMYVCTYVRTYVCVYNTDTYVRTYVQCVHSLNLQGGRSPALLHRTKRDVQICPVQQFCAGTKVLHTYVQEKHVHIM